MDLTSFMQSLWFQICVTMILSATIPSKRLPMKVKMPKPTRIRNVSMLVDEMSEYNPHRKSASSLQSHRRSAIAIFMNRHTSEKKSLMEQQDDTSDSLRNAPDQQTTKKSVSGYQKNLRQQIKKMSKRDALQIASGRGDPKADIPPPDPGQTQSHYRETLDESELQSVASCDHVNNYNERHWLLLVMKCPTGWESQNVKLLCESWDMVEGKTYLDNVALLPVQDKTGIVYANVYCAICNRIMPIHPWQTTLQCDGASEPTSESEHRGGPKSFLEGKIPLPAAAVPATDHCKRSIQPWKTDAFIDCRPPPWLKIKYLRNSHSMSKIGDSSSHLVSFNLLLNFDFAGNTHLLFSAGQQVVESDDPHMCQPSETYDTYVNRCRPISCDSSHRLENGKCVFKGTSTNTVSWSLEDIDQLPQLQDIAIVTLMVNITFGDYVLYFMNEDGSLEGDIPTQISENLKIAPDRIKHVGVDFEFGAMKGSAAQVRKLTKEEYERLMGDNEGGDITEIGGHRESPEDIREIGGGRDSNGSVNKVGGELGEHEVGTGNLPGVSIRERNFGASSSTQTTHRSSLTTSANENGNYQPIYLSGARSKRSAAAQDPEQLKSLKQDNIGNTLLSKSLGAQTKGVVKQSTRKPTPYKKSSHNTTANNKENAKPRISAVSDYNPKVLTPNGVKSKNTSGGGNRNKKTLKIDGLGSWQKMNETDKFSGFFSGSMRLTQKSAISTRSRFNFKILPNNTLLYDTNEVGVELESGDENIYMSPAKNGSGDRVLLKSDVGNITTQPTAMQISFILGRTSNPREQSPTALAKKISDLVLDRELHLQVSGKGITVTKTRHKTESEFNNVGEIYCYWGRMYTFVDDEFSLVHSNNDTMLYVNKTNTYYPIGKFRFNVRASGNSMADTTNFTLYTRVVNVCQMPEIKQKSCRRITIFNYEYSVIEKSKSIIFQEKEYDINFYEVLNETSGLIAICVPESYGVYNRIGNVTTIEGGCGSEFLEVMQLDGYLTLILGRLSVAALALVLITYCLFKSLRNLPGCNTMNLTLALLIAQVVFTEGMVVSKPWLCSAVAITEHFTRLAAQFWMSVISYDVYRTFSEPTMSTKFREMRKQFLKYFLYAWGLPFLIVSMCMAVDFSHIFPGVYIGYGGLHGASQMNDAYLANVTTSGQESDSSSYLDMSDVFQNDTDLSTDTYESFNDTSPNLILPYKATCWIGNSLANLIVFGAPVFIIMTVNCVFFVRTIVNIKKTTKSSMTSLTYRHIDSSRSKTTRRADVMLYLRMSTVMGLTWIFGFIWSMMSSFASVHTKTICIVVLTLGILSTIFNVSQGIFIFMAFVLNRRVFSLYTELFTLVKRRIPSNIPKSRLYSVSSTTSDISLGKNSLQIHGK